MKWGKISFFVILVIALFVCSFSVSAFDISLQKGWNLVSVYTTADIDIDSQCPTQNPKAFIIKGSRLDVSTDTLQSGESYLIKVSNNCNLNFEGESIQPNSTNLTKGWNMIYAYLDTGMNYIEDQCGKSVAFTLKNENGRNILYPEKDILHAGVTYLLRIEDNCTVDLGQNTGVSNCTECCRNNGYANAVSPNKMNLTQCADPYMPVFGCPNCSVTFEVCCCDNQTLTCGNMSGVICEDTQICYNGNFVSSSDSEGMCCVGGVCANLSDDFRPNLMISSISTEPYPVNTSHTSVNISVNITNNGLEDSGPFIIQLFYQKTVFPHVDLIGDVKAGATYTKTFTATVLNAEAKAGDGKTVGIGGNTIVVNADYFNQVEETNENDNMRTENVTVTTGTVGDTTPPAITASSPSGNSVDKSSNIWVQFSEEVLLTYFEYSITYSDGVAVSVGQPQYTASDKKITFAPTSALQYNKIVYVNITNITDLAGNYLAAPYSFSFRVQSEPAPQQCASPSKCIGAGDPNCAATTSHTCSAGKECCTGCKSGWRFGSNNCEQIPVQTKPNAPSNVIFEDVTHEQIRVKWNDNSNNEQGFYVYYNIENNRTTATKVTKVRDSTGETITGLPANNHYYFWVTAYNNKGESSAATNDTQTLAAPPQCIDTTNQHCVDTKNTDTMEDGAGVCADNKVCIKCLNGHRWNGTDCEVIPGSQALLITNPTTDGIVVTLSGGNIVYSGKGTHDIEGRMIGAAHVKYISKYITQNENQDCGSVPVSTYLYSSNIVEQATTTFGFIKEFEFDTGFHPSASGQWAICVAALDESRMIVDSAKRIVDIQGGGTTAISITKPSSDGITAVLDSSNNIVTTDGTGVGVSAIGTSGVAYVSVVVKSGDVSCNLDNFEYASGVKNTTNL
ncbi:MAG: Ig-like domain-containing protein, partial [Candidatus Aenigmarchaeota archaeon]|nr:Ig-like domain-containing protein [Candidatus Aenigmarchaeota archaeon]